MLPTAPDTPSSLELPACDVTRRTVRVLRRRANGFVEFEFSIGWPQLVVELMLPQGDFEAFCQAQRARILSEPEEESTAP